MIRYLCNKEGENVLEFHGTPITLAADALGLLVLLYTRLQVKSPEDAELFVKAVTRVINDKDEGAFSSVMQEAAAASFEEGDYE